MANNVIFKVGTKAVYDALQQKDANTLYWLTDVKEIRKGEELYAVGREATAAAAGLMSAADKAGLWLAASNTASRIRSWLLVTSKGMVLIPCSEGTST